MFRTGWRTAAAKLLPAVLFATGVAAAQNPSPSAVGWLRYAIPPDPARYHDMPHAVALLGDGNGHAALEEQTAADELDRGLGHMVAGTDILLHHFDPRSDSIIMGTQEAVRRARIARFVPGWTDRPLPEEGFRIAHLHRGARQWWLLEGGSPRAELYAAFRFSALVAQDAQLPEELVESARIPLRAVQLDGAVPEDAVLREYARLLASVGINGILLDDAAQKPEAVRIFRPYGIRVWTGNADFQASSHLPIHPATFPDAPMSGLALPPSSPGPYAALLPLLPGGIRQPVTPLQAWKRLPKGAAAHPDAILATIPAAAVVPLLDQPLFHASLFAFGRFAWNPGADGDGILDDWARQTWGDDARIFATAKKIVANGEAAYAGLTSPLGLPRLGDERGPDPATAATHGSGSPVTHGGIGSSRIELSLWPTAFRERYATPAATPAEWLLLLHRVPPGFPVEGTGTALQSVYDAEFTAASNAANAADAWDSTRGLVEPERWQPVHNLLEESARRAEIWRDATTEWLLRSTGTPDSLGFVGHHPGRIEAESMTLTRYREVFTREKEYASGGAYAACPAADCIASTAFHGEADVYRVEAGYFDNGGTPRRFTLLVNGAVRATWTSAARSGGEPGGETAERFVVNGVHLEKDDRIEIRSAGSLDFLEITRDPRWN